MKIAHEVIRDAFHQCGIPLQDHENFSNVLSVPNSVTNQYIKVTDRLGTVHSLRINGRLWQPFNRENESRYLRYLKQHGVQHNVLWEDIEHGFQICQLYPEEISFEKILCKRDADFERVSREIRQYHQIQTFDNHVSVPHMIDDAISRSPKNLQYDSLGILIKKMLLTLCGDVGNYVLSHNDLLPSNVYLQGDHARIIDWEYVGKNHRTYDLAMLAVQSGLTSYQEAKLLFYYDQTDRWDTQYSFIKMKPVISFLLLQWHLIRSPQRNCAHLALNLIVHIQEALALQVMKMLRFEHRLFFVVSSFSKTSLVSNRQDMGSSERPRDKIDQRTRPCR